jgi:hypothetical protein
VTLNRLGRARYEKITPQSAERCDAMRCDAMRCDAMRCDELSAYPVYLRANKLMDTKQIRHPL